MDAEKPKNAQTDCEQLARPIYIKLEDLHDEYEKVRDKVVPILSFTRESRKYGFPIICGIEGKTDKEQFVWAARLILHIAGLELDESAVDELFVETITNMGGSFKTDVIALLSVARGNSQQFR